LSALTEKSQRVRRKMQMLEGKKDLGPCKAAKSENPPTRVKGRWGTLVQFSGMGVREH